MKKSVLVLSLLLVCSIFVNAEGMTHSASEICVEIKPSVFVSLQTVVNENYFNSIILDSASLSGNSCSNIMHYADEILIKNVAGNVMTLQEAVTYNKLKSGSGTITSLSKGHLNASEIIFSDGETLQEKINNNQMCKSLTCDELSKDCGSGYDDGCGGVLDCGSCSVGVCNSNGVCAVPDPVYTYSWSIGSWSGNGACPTTTFTRTVYCRRNDGTNMGSTCDAYSGCSCSNKPVSSTTTTCKWVLGSYIQCGTGGEVYYLTGANPGDNCRSGYSAGSSGYWWSGTECSCGTSCSAHEVYHITCTTTSP